MKFTTASALAFLLIACSSEPQTSEPSRSLHKADSFYIVNDKLVREQYDTNGVLLSKTLYGQQGDTTFYANGKPEHVNTGAAADFNGVQYEYYRNGQLKQKHQQGSPFGCGCPVGEEENYDSLGHRTSRVTYDNYLPAGQEGCHQQMTVIRTVLFYASGQDSLRKQEETAYESGRECPCGTWEYLGKDGKVIRKEQFEKCRDGKMECRED